MTTPAPIDTDELRAIARRTQDIPNRRAITRAADEIDALRKQLDEAQKMNGALEYRMMALRSDPA